jgi:hypothetical protein
MVQYIYGVVLWRDWDDPQGIIIQYNIKGFKAYYMK